MAKICSGYQVVHPKQEVCHVALGLFLLVCAFRLRTCNFVVFLCSVCCLVVQYSQELSTRPKLRCILFGTRYQHILAISFG